MASSPTYVIGSLVLAACVISTSITFAQSPTKPPAGRFQLLPASPEPPEIIAEQQNAEQALKTVNQGRLSPQQKRQHLLNHVKPTIREKAQLAARHTPRQPLPASPDSTELLAQQQDAELALKRIEQGRLSPQQKRQLLLNHPAPSIRAKAQEAQRFNHRQMGSFDRPDSLAVLPFILSLLNPFSVSDVYAQSPFSVTLTPQTRYSATHRASLSLHGCSAGGGTAGFTAFNCTNFSVQSVGHVIARPYIAVSVTIPRLGWYLLDFYGYGKPKATLQKHVNLFTRQNLESWDTTASPTFLNHFATAEYLTQGNHTFYLSIDSSSLWFYEASIDEF